MYEINKELENSVLKDMPTSYSNLEKAVYIYYELCKKLQYSMGYYIDQENYRSYFQDVDNLKKVDGVKNKDVVCFTFNAIFLKILVDAKIISPDSLNQLDIQQHPSVKTKQIFPLAHSEIFIDIDAKVYNIDSTFGVLDNNDLAL